MKKILLLTLCIILLFTFVGCSIEEVSNETSSIELQQSKLNVIFIDVGQGDSELIVTPSGKTMLIDAGSRDEGYKVADTINKYKLKKLDIIVATHPHEDHIGGLIDIINKYDIGEIYMPKASANTDTFKDLLTAVKDKGLKIRTAKTGINLDLDADIKAEILSPNKSYEDLNNMSAVIRLSYKNTSFLFMGDAEKKAERDMMKSLTSSDVIKIGHHGSSSSTSKKFIEKVNPVAAVISCGKDNEYNHPHKETVELLKSKSIKLYRTNMDGTINMVSDGDKITLNKKE